MLCEMLALNMCRNEFQTKAYVLPRDAILDSQPSRVVRNIGYMLELGTGVDEDYRIPFGC